MITIDGKWIPEGLNRRDPSRIKSSEELTEFVEEVGFLPLFKNHIPGFSVEERSASDYWWSGEKEDPWGWREVIASQGRVAYGKLFSNRAGFISKEWYPYFAVLRRDGYDFDSRYEDGLASRKQKNIIDVLEMRGPMLSFELKKAAGFHKDGEKGFEGAISALQMQTYLLIRGFRRRMNKKQEEYGWSIAEYALSEQVFGADHVRSAYGIGPAEALNRLADKLKKHFPSVGDKEAEKIIR
jgi:hypothetical protein